MEVIKDLEYYTALDYDIAVRVLDESEGGGFLAYYVDIPFIMGDGETKEEAIKDVKSAFVTFGAKLSSFGEDSSFVEKSQFHKVSGVWLYHSGEFLDPLKS